jgi:hypothetical protein
MNILIQILFKILLALFIVYTSAKIILRGSYIHAARFTIRLNDSCERFINGDDPIDR